jgi:hypothetical protein
MKRWILVTGVMLATLAVPSAAHAEYYLDRGQAEDFAVDFAESKYGDASYVAVCRPQGLNRPKAGYIYHRWVCGWADDYGCAGRLRIIGSRGRGYYYGRVLSGQRCPA